MKGIQGSRILVVEDEFLIAEEISRTLQIAGAEVMGPEPTVERAMRRLNSGPVPDFAILDINLRGDPVFPVADALRRSGSRFVFFTGYDIEGMPKRFEGIGLVDKSSSVVRLVDELLRPGINMYLVQNDSPEAALPLLRRIAYSHTADYEGADQIVEHVLLEAIARHADRPQNLSLRSWLIQLLRARLDMKSDIH